MVPFYVVADRYQHSRIDERRRDANLVWESLDQRLISDQLQISNREEKSDWSWVSIETSWLGTEASGYQLRKDKEKQASGKDDWCLAQQPQEAGRILIITKNHPGKSGKSDCRYRRSQR